MARLAGVRFVAALGTVTLLAGVLGAGLGSTPAEASTYPNVNTEAGLRTAFGDPSATLIDLTANITLTNCGAGTVPRNSPTPLVLDGDGYTVTQTCPDSVFTQDGTGSLSFQNIVITGGGGTSPGGGIDTGGAVSVTNSAITGNHLTAGADSILHGGGISTAASATVTNSAITGNALTAGTDSILEGGGIYTGAPTSR